MFNQRPNNSISKSSLDNAPWREMMVELAANDEQSLSGGSVPTVKPLSDRLPVTSMLTLLFANPFA